MNRILKSTAAVLICAGLVGHAAAAELTVRVEGVKKAAGTIHIAVFDEAGWSANTAVAGGTVTAGEGAELILTDLAPGTYGIKLYQDADENGKLNLGLLGIPSEPYGFSNDVSVRTGPPRFGKASFEVTEAGAVQTITLN